MQDMGRVLVFLLAVYGMLCHASWPAFHTDAAAVPMQQKPYSIVPPDSHPVKAAANKAGQTENSQGPAHSPAAK